MTRADYSQPLTPGYPWVRAFTGIGSGSFTVNHTHGDTDRVTIKLSIKDKATNDTSETSIVVGSEEAFKIASSLIECAYAAEEDLLDQLAHEVSGRPRR